MTGASSELRIYDEIDGQLILGFTYTPPTRCAGSLSAFHSIDIFNDGHNELVGSINEAVDLKIPMTIDWNNAQQRYQAWPLITEYPYELSNPVQFLMSAEDLVPVDVRVYTHSLPVGKSPVGNSPVGYALSDFKVIPKEGVIPPHLFGVYRLRRGTQDRPKIGRELFQSAVLMLGQTRRRIRSSWCSIGRRNSLIVVNPYAGPLVSEEDATDSVTRYSHYPKHCDYTGDLE